MANQDTAQGQEGRTNVGATLIADAQPTVLMQPTDRPLHDPTEHAQPLPCSVFRRAMFGRIPRSTSASRCGSKSYARFARSSAVHGVTDLAGNRRDGVNQRDQLSHVMAVAACQRGSQRNAVGVGDEVCLEPFLRDLQGWDRYFCPPPTARTCELSTTAVERSSCSSARNQSSRTRCTLSHTPAFCQAWRYRQQRMPHPQPFPAGTTPTVCLSSARTRSP